MEAIVEPIVRRELGTAPSKVERPAEGLQHETYQVECDGEEYVLQFAGEEPRHRDDLARGLACYRALSDASVPVPGVVTESVRTLEGREYVLVERIRGENAERDVSPRRVRAAGRCLARIHDAFEFESTGPLVAGDGETTLAVGRYPDGPLDRRIRRILDRSVDVLDDRGLDRASEAVGSLFDDPPGFPPSPSEFDPVLCHDDFSPDNVLFEGGDLIGVLDFDRAYAGHDQRDLAQAANGFWMHDPCADRAIRETFYEAYREVRDPGPTFERNEPLYRVETLVRTVAGMANVCGLSETEVDVYDRAILAAVERAKE